MKSLWSCVHEIITKGKRGRICNVISRSKHLSAQFVVLSGSVVVIRRKAIALNMSNILNWTTFLTFFRQSTHEIYRGINSNRAV